MTSQQQRKHLKIYQEDLQLGTFFLGIFDNLSKEEQEEDRKEREREHIEQDGRDALEQEMLAEPFKREID